jgi:hypothetical protein
LERDCARVPTGRGKPQAVAEIGGKVQEGVRISFSGADGEEVVRPRAPRQALPRRGCEDALHTERKLGRRRTFEKGLLGEHPQADEREEEPSSRESSCCGRNPRDVRGEAPECSLALEGRLAFAVGAREVPDRHASRDPHGQPMAPFGQPSVLRLDEETLVPRNHVLAGEVTGPHRIRLTEYCPAEEPATTLLALTSTGSHASKQFAGPSLVSVTRAIFFGDDAGGATGLRSATTALRYANWRMRHVSWRGGTAQ